MTLKVTMANGSSDSVDFVNVAGTTLAQVKGYDDGSSNGHVEIYTTSAGTSSEKVRIDKDGNLLVGTTSVVNAGKFSLSGDFGTARGVTIQSSASTSAVALFLTSTSTTAGRIDSSGSSTTYATSSDYRLKENIAPMTGALNKVAALKPVTYKWKADGSDGQGFIAHELQEVVEGCVVGEKDAIDADGNPVYQGIDTSFLVATLTAAIQEQQALITQQAAALTTLTERITALEAK
jgi:hypothetical protein